jgi:NTE family protein
METTPAASKSALILAGGGIMGAAYEIGCLSALDRLFTHAFSVCRFDLFVGISAGSVVAALTANGVPPFRLFKDILHDVPSPFNFNRSDIYRVDSRQMLASCWRFLSNLWHISRHYRQQNWRSSRADLVHILQEQFPAGLFSLEPLQKYLCHAFAQAGLADRFDELHRELYIPAYDLDRGERVIFGSAGERELHLCQAITASCAIPYFFRPPRIGGRHFVDGSTGQMAHLDIAIERGAKLIVLVNPRVPLVNDQDFCCLPSLSYGRCSGIAELGISFAWEQSQRIANKEKLDQALANCRRNHPEVDILLIEPGQEEALLFFQSPMSGAARRHIMSYGYDLTLGQLKANFASHQQLFARHGIALSQERLASAPAVEILG